ncbi:MAG TPA: aminotransferase class V-fold PLP-dependent enzyme [Clostridiaceae bacterium]|nr:aminotransferase class V-fold PLP-dependent enzyme [Clostridiaceae bacterium]
MIYLDNAATSFPKPLRVYDEMDRCMRTYCANPGRGGHAMSIASGKAVSEAREKIAAFFNIDNSLRLAFTKNATEAINIAIKGVIKPGDHVITTCMEHNAVIRPLKTLEKDGIISLSIVEGDNFGRIDIERIIDYINPRTRLIVSTLSSNVNGIIFPVKEMGRIARTRGILFLVDASQGAGAEEIDVDEMNIDLLAFPGHKGLLGPQGTGGIYIREGINITPIMQGGTGSISDYLYQPEMMPDLIESGTLNTPGIIGLAYGVDFINKTGLNNIKVFKHSLIKRLMEGMEEIKGIVQYSLKDIDNNSGIAAMNFKGVDSSEVSYILDKEFGIATRAGLHCAPLAHKTLGTTGQGVVRFSVGCFNTVDEIDYTLKALRKISSRFN